MDNRILQSHSLSSLLLAVFSKAIHTAHLANQPLCLLSKRMTLIEASRRISDLLNSNSSLSYNMQPSYHDVNAHRRPVVNTRLRQVRAGYK